MATSTFSPRLAPLTSMYTPTEDFKLDGKPAEKSLSHMSLDAYVKAKGGKRVITKILIANNGIAAVKAIRSIRRWTYETLGSDKVIDFVVMATPEDIKANAQYIHLADEFIQVPGGSNNNNYANVNLITEIAERVGAHAVWAGWGHASENPLLPDMLAKSKNGCIWIGPPSSAMRALGDKIGSTLIAQSAGVPCMPWNGDGIKVDYANTGLPDDVYEKACVHDVKEAEDCAARIGFPVMIKASAGGGGKGIRKVEKQEQIAAAFRQVQGEVPGSPIFIMKLAGCARHLEVQLLADEWGNAIAVAGRDCSVQRRHQKIIEEGPVVAAPPAIWREMERSAVRLAKEVGYVGAGTVEYLYMPDGTYCFLELNPRLQVEHPVTELISGVNLPAGQLQVAMGIPLHQVSGVRRMYGESLDTTTVIDFDNRETTLLPGHVIACRVTAENPDMEFQPTSGVIFELNFRSTPDVWGYFSVGAQGGVHEYSDSQFGHMFALGETREIARKNMVLALKELSIRGDIRTTVEYLRQILETEDFKKNNIDTTWLERVMAKKGVEREKPETHLAVLLGALFRAYKASNLRLKEYMSCLERGQLPSTSLHQELTEQSVQLIYEQTKYFLKITKSGPSSFDLAINDWLASADVHTLADEGMLVLLDGKKHVVYGQEFPSGLRLTVDGKTCLFREEYDPTQLRSGMAGKLVRFLVDDGAHLTKDQPYAELEVMKMYITLTAPESGVVHILKPDGAILEAGDLIATMQLDDPGRVRKADVFKGSFPPLRNPTAIGMKPHLLLQDTLNKIHMLLSGYQLGSGVLTRSLSTMMQCLRDPSLPLHQFRESISAIAGRIPEPLYKSLTDIAHTYAQSIATTNRFYWESPEAFPALEMKENIDAYASKLSKVEQTALMAQLQAAGVMTLLHSYQNGNHSYAVNVLSSLLEEYFSVESYFIKGQQPELVIKKLRKEFKDDLASVARIARAHHQIVQRNELVMQLLAIIEGQLAPLTAEFIPVLRKFTTLSGKEYSPVVVKTRQIIMRFELPSASQRRIGLNTILSAASTAHNEERTALMAPLIDQSQPIEDLIFTFLANQRVSIMTTALEVYIRRVYQAYTIKELYTRQEASGMLLGRWVFHQRDGTVLAATGLASSPSLTSLSGMGAPASGDQRQQYGIQKTDSLYNIAQLRSKVEKTPKSLGGRPLIPSAGVPISPASVTPSTLQPLPLAFASQPSQPLGRLGVIALFKDFDTLKSQFDSVLREFNVEPPSPSSTSASPASSPTNSVPEPVHVLYLGVHFAQKLPEDSALSHYFGSFVRSHESELTERGVRRVTFIVTHGNRDQHPGYFTFRHRANYEEDANVRHIEPPYALYMQLQRLSNFDISYVPTKNHMVHLFAAHPLTSASGESKAAHPQAYDGRRFFVRALVRKVNQDDILSNGDDYLDLDAHPEAEYAFVEALNELEIALGGDNRSWRFNSIFLNVLAEAYLDVRQVIALLRALARRYSEKIRRLRVSMVELTLPVKKSPHATSSTAYRIVATNPTGHVMNIDTYEERRDLQSGQIRFKRVYFDRDQQVNRCTHQEGTQWDGLDIYTPYEVSHPLQNQRLAAEAVDTVYAYDFLPIIEHAVQKSWWRAGQASKANKSDSLDEKQAAASPSSLSATLSLPSVYLESVELVLPPNANIEDHASLQLQTSHRAPGHNDVGMVAFKLTMYTPEYPQGREVILVANDITHRVGTFGPREDLVFKLASKYARQHGLPRLYFAANSGARIGLAEEVKPKIKAAWVNNDPNKGVEYLYLSAEDYNELKDAVIASKLETKNGQGQTEVRYVLSDIIGRRDGLGVENLRGSGMIAGETSLAYDDIFTLTYVTGRTVGIGAYLARLGQRCIQKQTPSIILTGYVALNKLLGRPVYTSNDQLGGPDIMYTNGVSHLVVEDDMEGVSAALQWLSYIPSKRFEIAPVSPLASLDPVDRPVLFKPGKQPYDPRCLIQGAPNPNAKNQWLSGLFDHKSFMEVLGGWAKEVVAGRARLGGYPVGVVAVETRTVEMVSPADPASPESKEQVFQRAGGVWYPASAFKTAQAIKDMVAEDLPVFILANWRGFSGGMRDMFDEVLKYGSYIVDSLRAVRQPVFVYLPPGATLRGGAWVVVDSTINEQYVEMYAEDSSRGGVLEAEGTVEVMFRARDLLKTMHRLDSQLIALDQQLAELDKADSKTTAANAEATSSSSQPRDAIVKQIRAREKALSPIYHQVAVQFADLHDTPGRMKAKGAIREIVNWESSRSYFYWRMRRRVMETQILKNIVAADPVYGQEEGWKQASQLFVSWVTMDLTATYAPSTLTNDKLTVEWIESRQSFIESQLAALHSDCMARDLHQLLTRAASSSGDKLVQTLVDAMKRLAPEQKQALQAAVMGSPSSSQ